MNTLFLVSLFAVPVAVIVVVTRRAGFAIWTTLAASVIGVYLAVFIDSWYMRSRAERILQGKENGVVAFMHTTDVAKRVSAWLIVSALGLAIGCAAILARWIYFRTRARSDSNHPA
jgi:hypothetical protein